MKIILIYLKAIFFSINLIFSQTSSSEFDPFKAGENLEYRVHYGIFNASYASLTLSNEKVDGQDVLLASGYGKTIGLARLFSKLRIITVAILNQKKYNQSFSKEIFTKGDIQKIWKLVLTQKKKKLL